MVTSAPRFALSSRNCTPATEVSSVAVADIVTVLVTLEPFCGAVTDTWGGVLSTVKVMAVEVAWLLAVSVAVAEKEWDPGVAVTVSHWIE